MAEGIKTPPKSDGLNFSIWKVKMTVFLQSLGSRVVKVVTKPFRVLIGDEDTQSDIATKEFDANVKTHYVLLQALNDVDICNSLIQWVRRRYCDVYTQVGNTLTYIR